MYDREAIERIRTQRERWESGELREFLARQPEARAASSKSKDECISGWLADAGDLIAGEDPKFVRLLLSYYIDSSLRGTPPAICRSGA